MSKLHLTMMLWSKIIVLWNLYTYHLPLWLPWQFRKSFEKWACALERLLCEINIYEIMEKNIISLFFIMMICWYKNLYNYHLLLCFPW